MPEVYKQKLEKYEDYIDHLSNMNINFKPLHISNFTLFWEKFGLDTDFSFTHRNKCLWQIVSGILNNKITLEEFTLMGEKRIEISRQNARSTYIAKNALVSFNEHSDFNVLVSFVDELIFGQKVLIDMHGKMN